MTWKIASLSAKQISKRTKLSLYSKKEDPLDKTNYRPIRILPQQFSKEYYSFSYNFFQINVFHLCFVKLGKGTVLNSL